MKSKIESSGICALFILLFVLGGISYYKTQKRVSELEDELQEMKVILTNSNFPNRPGPEKPPPFWNAGFTVEYQ